MKQLKFASELVPLILSGEKTCTWRLWDDKDLSQGDLLSLVDADNRLEFAQATVISVIEKPLGGLSDADKRGHEGFASDTELYTAYSRYYGRLVGPKTTVKVVRFEVNL